MSSDLLSLVGLLVSVIGILIGVASNYWFARKQSSRKSLLYEVALNAGIDAQGEIIRDMSKWFDRRRRRLVIIGIKNDGTETIVPADYVRDMTFRFGDRAVIQSASVVKSSPPSIGPTLVVNAECLLVKPTLLNSGDSFVIRVVIRAYAGLTEDFRISGTHVYEYNEPRPLLLRWWFILAVTSAIWCSSYLVVRWRHLPSLLVSIITLTGVFCVVFRALWSLTHLRQRSINRWRNIDKVADGPQKIG